MDTDRVAQLLPPDTTLRGALLKATALYHALVGAREGKSMLDGVDLGALEQMAFELHIIIRGLAEKEYPE